MSPKVQRAEIATIMGWTKIRSWNGALIGLPPKTPSVSATKQVAQLLEQSLPDYLSDLNAIRTAVLTITEKNLQACFIGDLERIVARDPNANLWSWALTTSTAEQQAEAFLRTKDILKWK